jgi:carbonic anhydrase/acetyltransferase-like protein (isoleucine patch superfamily)
VVLRVLWKMRFPKCNVMFDYPPRTVPKVMVGDFSYSSEISLLLASPWRVSNTPLIIGKYCSIAPGVVMELSTGHDRFDRALYPLSVDESNGHYYSRGGIRIGNDVWIGHSALIRSGVRIGDSSVVAAKSVVSENVPSHSVVGGVPAKLLGDRGNSEWKSDPWWEWNREQIGLRLRELKRYMNRDLE